MDKAPENLAQQNVYITSAEDFFNTFIAPFRPKRFSDDHDDPEIKDNHYNQFDYFNQRILVENARVIYQIDQEKKLTSFLVFGRRREKDLHTNIYCISVHPKHRNTGKAKILLDICGEETIKLGLNQIKTGEPIYQPFDNGPILKWATCIYRILQGKGLEVIK